MRNVTALWCLHAGTIVVMRPEHSVIVVICTWSCAPERWAVILGHKQQLDGFSLLLPSYYT
jgi:hypothetical protein